VAHALDRHVALIGFMGAGKTTLGAPAAMRLGRRFIDLDRELERSLEQTIPELFEQRGEAEFRVLEAEATLSALCNERPAVLALGGGAVETPSIRRALKENALTVLVDVDAQTAWTRIGGSARPLARDEESFHALFGRRRPLYAETADAIAVDVDGIVLAAAGIVVEEGSLARLRELVPDGEVEVIADATVLGLHRPPLEGPVHALRGGEEAKSLGAVERLWRELQLGRDGTIAAFGGGRVRGGDLPARHRLGRGADDARRSGGRGDWRQDSRQPPRGQEPRRCVPLAGANGHRHRAPRDVAGERAARRDGRGREDGAPCG
jgi:shikimate kinase